MEGAPRSKAEQSFRRMAWAAALLGGALAFGAAYVTPGFGTTRAALVGLAVAFALWSLLVAIFVLGPMDAARLAEAAAASAAPDPAAAAAPVAADRAAEPVDPLPITRPVPPQDRVRPPHHMPARPHSVPPPDLAGGPGIAGGLDAAVARSHATATVQPGPLRLAAPRGGRADDLKVIRGIGPKLEALLNSVGIWHYDQIAAWKARDIAEIDGQLEGFRGRITRDGWVKQARALALSQAAAPAKGRGA
jgi:NADH-quinone oxidoreductase subunit E